MVKYHFLIFTPQIFSQIKKYKFQIFQMLKFDINNKKKIVNLQKSGISHQDSKG